MSAGHKPTILIVDDTPANLRLLTDLLTAQGFRVRPAPNGERALATIQKERPDLILLDIMMPEMNGYDVCRQLKQADGTRDIPVIFISALDEVFDKVTAFGAGGVDYITKPFQVEEVLARVRTHLSLEDLRQTLQAQNRQLQEQNRELDAFASTVAHDLKNPLAALVAALGLVEEGAARLDPETQEMLRLSLNNAHKLGNIIDELLLLASVRKEAVTRGPVNMDKVVAQALARLAPMLEQHQPELRAPEHWPTVMSYAPWIEEVWANYLSNGLKYGGQPPCLELGATPQAGGRIRFWVHDNGPGLTPEAQAKLFAEFSRLDKLRAHGHGLGLSIVRRIMDKLDGQCGVESAPGQGSTFYFELPDVKRE